MNEEEKPPVVIQLNWVQAKNCYQVGTVCCLFGTGYRPPPESEFDLLRILKNFIEYCNNGHMEQLLELGENHIRQLLLWFEWNVTNAKNHSRVSELTKDQLSFYETLKFLDLMHNIMPKIDYWRY